MKALFVVSIALLSTAAFADNGFIPAELGLSKQCAEKVVSETIRQCNIDSKAAEGTARMNPCQEAQVNVKSDNAEAPEFEVDYAAGDADDYWYDVRMTDKAECAFTFSAEQ